MSSDPSLPEQAPLSKESPDADSPGSGRDGEGAAPKAASRPLRAYLVDRGPPRWVYVLALVYVAIAVAQYVLDRPGVRERGPGVEIWLFQNLSHDRTRVWEGEYWRLITSTFLHAGLLHLGANVLFFLYFGRVVERWLGHRRFLGYYFLCALAGALLFQAISDGGLGVGASGGILGLLGMLFVLYFGLRSKTGSVLGRRFWIFLNIAVVLLFVDAAVTSFFFSGFGRHRTEVAVSAHFGGFFTGIFLGYIAYEPPGRAAHRARRKMAALMLSALLLGTGFYGLVYPAFDWSWHIWRAEKALAAGGREEAEARYERARSLGGDIAAAEILRVEAEKGDLERALRYWREYPIADRDVRMEAGYIYLYDNLAAEGWDEESDAFLDEMIELADEALQKERTPARLNTAAWFRALRRTDLDKALEYASEASSREAESAFLNTLGWVQFELGDDAKAFRNLEQAARLEPLGENFFYLALAYWKRLGTRLDKDKARVLVQNALRARGGSLLKHQRRRLEPIREFVEGR